MSYTKFYDTKQLKVAGDVLHSLLERFEPQCPILLFVYTFEPGSVSFVANYPERSKSIDVIQQKLKRWETNAPRILYNPKQHGWLPQKEDLEQWHEWLQAELKKRAPDCGYALFAGQGGFTQYQASGAREGVIEMLRDVVKNVKREMA